MDLPSLLPYIPKTALTLLVIVGGFIAFEIYAMIEHASPKKKKDAKPDEGPDTLEPLKFPKISNLKIKKDPTKTKIAWSPKAIGTGIIVSLLAAGLIAALYFINTGKITINIPLIINIIAPGSQPLPADPSPVPPSETPQPVVYNAQIVLYRETDTNNWEPIVEEELSSLLSGDVIRIAVKTETPADRIDITVNGQSIPLAGNLSPSDEPYARFVIPHGESEYKVAARIY